MYVDKSYLKNVLCLFSAKLIIGVDTGTSITGPITTANAAP
ncbi:hypothetical protein CLV60_1077 [Dyadobacter jiangsuensis]|uniref:Uncharacterized protein n=1 Tax=Dyadobacter jiangsuensis TaxID=1591085 RepID=A0A2P8G1A2_9BACT|nr:hypothetical protein CLV60_1077 [Dyadobacter jiangsuensis]